MKKIIVILGTIILGVYIVATLVMGNQDGSLKKSADKIVNKGNAVIIDELFDVTP